LVGAPPLTLVSRLVSSEVNATNAPLPLMLASNDPPPGPIAPVPSASALLTLTRVVVPAPTSRRKTSL
jgi:hypothetical protein